MKTITDSLNVSLYIFEDNDSVTVGAESVVTPNFTIGDLNASNCTVALGVTPPADWVGRKYTYTAGVWALVANFVAPRQTPPQYVSMAQARKAMILSGVSIADVDAAIAGIADAQEKALAQTDWEYSATVRRYSDLTASLAPALNLTEDQIDQMFILADTL